MGSPIGRHWPFRSGYLVSSQARLSANVMQSAARKPNATIPLRYRMVVLLAAATNSLATPPTAGPLPVVRLEIAQIGRRLILAGGHEFAIRAQIVEFLADQHVCSCRRAILLAVNRVFAGLALVAFQHGPRPRIGMIDQRDLVVQDCRISLVEKDALLHDRLVFGMDRQAGRVQSPRALELAGLNFEQVEMAAAVLIDPFADRITLEARLDLVRPVAPVSVD